MFGHTGCLQFDVRPEKPGPVYARKLQELLGGAYGDAGQSPALFHLVSASGRECTAC